jgi:hypothetical protein
MTEHQGANNRGRTGLYFLHFKQGHESMRDPSQRSSACGGIQARRFRRLVRRAGLAATVVRQRQADAWLVWRAWRKSDKAQVLPWTGLAPLLERLHA